METLIKNSSAGVESQAGVLPRQQPNSSLAASRLNSGSLEK
ncbi:hypothetical protein [Roseateles sp.]